MNILTTPEAEEKLSLSKELLTSQLSMAIDQVLPLFKKNMPAAYFNAVEHSDQVAHLSALITAEMAGLEQNLLLTSMENSCYTFINRRNYRGLLTDLIKQLPKDKSLQSAKIFTSTSDDMVVDIFDFLPQRRFDTMNPDNRERLDHVIESVIEYEPDTELESLIQLLHTCSEDYVMMTSNRRICRHFNMIQSLWGTDNVEIESLVYAEDNYLDITIGFGNGDTRQVFERTCAYLGLHGFDIQRAHFETFQKDEGQVSLIGFLVSTVGEESPDLESSEWQSHLNNLRRIPALSNDVITLYINSPEWSLVHCELLYALGHLVHQRLCKVDPYRFTLEHILTVLIRNQALSCTIFDAIVDRFALEMSETELTDALINDDEFLALPENDSEIMQVLQKASTSILKTNLHLPSRYALSFRIEPDFLKVGDREVLPYGVFFVHGKNFNGFHVRFRDIARGGMRIVLPRKMDDYYHELDRLYDENYGLAYAQQLKNKDIPEGGSKGVLLLRPGNDFEQCGRAYADSLLDLIIPETTEKTRVDYFGKEELLYLGPDENVSPELINWIIKRAHTRLYPMANTFMSSKPTAGINHKVYGVTSEGVTVFLNEALRQRGINPNVDSFTIKITGGPDGDVAGNEILILDREYGDLAQIVGIADGSGVVEDPEGLCHEELIRLVKANLPITKFQTDKLGKDGRINKVDTLEGATARDSMHFRLKADAFIPAGGRPQAINLLNWENFLLEDGNPSSQIIVEGANLFITAEARLKLSEAGVMIIKDSSANKCGVICSSLEIIAGMLTDDSEFVKIKDQYVEQTMTRLRELAAMEAKALFYASTHRPHESLPELSMEMSIQINRIHDAISSAPEAVLTPVSANIDKLLREYIPQVLVDLVGDSFLHKIPEVYSRQIIASVIASRIVYQEGIDYCRYMSEEDIAQLAIEYLRQEDTVSDLIKKVEASDLEDKKVISHLLKVAGAGAAIKAS